MTSPATIGEAQHRLLMDAESTCVVGVVNDIGVATILTDDVDHPWHLVEIARELLQEALERLQADDADQVLQTGIHVAIGALPYGTASCGAA